MLRIKCFPTYEIKNCICLSSFTYDNEKFKNNVIVQGPFGRKD